MRLLLLGALLLPFGATAQQYGAWTVEVVDENTVGAYTTNSAGTMFGKLCFVATQQCIWVVSAFAECDNGATYSALSNSASGAYSHTLTCYGEKKIDQLLTFGEYEKMESISKNDPLVGVAIPMVDGEFRVSRFSLDGSVAACAAAEQIVVNAAKTEAAEYDI